MDFLNNQRLTTAELLHVIREGALVLTSNRRLAAYVEKALQSIDPKSHETRPSSMIFPLNDWIEKLWKQHQTQFSGSYRLLSSLSQEIIWERIIRESESGDILLRVNATAELAVEAWHMLQQWNISLEKLQSFAASEDISAFIDWAKQYQMICATEKWIDAGAVLEQFTKDIEVVCESLSCSQLILVGFEEYTPLFMRFFQALSTHHVKIASVLLIPEGGNHSCYRIKAKQSSEEFLFAGQWASECVADSKEPEIHIVVPQLDRLRSEVVRIFRESFPNLSVNIAAPLALSEYPMIKAAFLFLTLQKTEVEIKTLLHFLQSPFLGGGEEVNRFALGEIVYQWGERVWHWPELIRRIEHLDTKQSEAACPHLLIVLRTLASKASTLKGKQSLVSWSATFKEVLEDLGWPGDRTQNSEEYQLQQAWDKMLKEYADLQLLVKDLSLDEALERLHHLLQRTLFLPNTDSAKVQVLSVLESAGLPADYRWIVGMQQEDWPASPHPNPFIPLSLQRQYGVPHSSPEREWLMAKRLLHTLTTGAKTTVMSHAAVVNKQPSEVSALIRDVPIVEVQKLLQAHPKSIWENMPWREKGQEETNTSASHIIPILPQEKIKGGARILQLQAECPFRAFAEIRLQAKPKLTMTLGLTPIEKGEILHQVLAHFWKPLRDQQTLLALSEEKLEAAIEKSVSTVLSHWQKKRPATLKGRYLALEQQRLLNIMRQWIAIEKSRPHFTVEAHEREFQANFGSLDLKVRIDRIDSLANGELVLLDYKTGACNIYDWFGERPKAPQLPLYCILLQPSPIAIAFVVLRKDGVQFQGVTHEEQALPLLKKLPELSRFGADLDWVAQKNTWQTVLKKIAEEFALGVAHVDPRDGHSTCQFCHLESLCRIQEMAI